MTRISLPQCAAVVVTTAMLQPCCTAFSPSTLSPPPATTTPSSNRLPSIVDSRQTRLTMVGHIYDPNSISFDLDTSSSAFSSFSTDCDDVDQNDRNVIHKMTTDPDGLIAAQQPETLSPLEIFCLVRIEQWYQKALAHKCPFLRRRMTDFMDTLEMLVRVVIVQHHHRDLIGPPVGCRGDERTRHKTSFLSLEDRMDLIRKDWKEESGKGYYVTGRLTPSIYRDDCYFDGPDPDMPVRGLRKFLNAASQLFDPKSSRCDLLSLRMVGDVIVARWRFNGVLRLPWRPKLPEVVGTTIYHFDQNGLVYRHEETWDLSAVDAFLKTAWFDFKGKVSNVHNEEVTT